MARKKIALYGLSANPAGTHHRKIVELLISIFDLVIIVPCGPRPEPEKATVSDIAPLHRATTTDMTFMDLPKVRIDLDDLEKVKFTRTIDLVNKYEKEGEVWIAVGTDLVQGGGKGKSVIQRDWKDGKRLWNAARFAVIPRQGYELHKDDLPPRHQVFGAGVSGSSTEIRNKAFNHQSIAGLVTPEVESYIERWGLYRGLPKTSTIMRLREPRLFLVVDDRNERAIKIAKKLGDISYSSPHDGNLIVGIGGDGTMLRTRRAYWRKRLPFLGINAGGIGFLMNDIRKDFSTEMFFKKLLVYQSPMLYVEAVSPDGKIISGLASNDAWVQVQIGGTAWIEIKVDGKVCVEKLVADGALVSTAAGSNAYARSMGATPIKVGTPNLVLAGSNVCRPLAWKNPILPIESIVEFRTVDPTRRPKKRPIFGFIDGVPCGEVESMKIRISQIAAVELAYYYPGNDPGKKLAQLQFPQKR